MMTAWSQSLDESADNTAENIQATREVGCIIGRLAAVVKAGGRDFFARTTENVCCIEKVFRPQLMRPEHFVLSEVSHLAKSAQVRVEVRDNWATTLTAAHCALRHPAPLGSNW